MKNPGTQLLNVVERASEHLGVLTALIDRLTNFVVPQTNALAFATCPSTGVVCGGPTCGACCANCSGDYRSYIFVEMSQNLDCSNATWCVSDCTYC